MPEDMPSAGSALRRFIVAILFWGAFTLGALFGAGFCVWMVIYNSSNGEWSSAAFMAGVGLLPSTFFVWTLKNGRLDLKERWAQVQASNDAVLDGGVALVATSAIPSPLGATGQIGFVIYLFTLHPLWITRVRASIESNQHDWITLLIVVTALALEHWGGDGLLRTIPRPPAGLGTLPTMVHGLSRMARMGFMTCFLGMGLAAAGILQVEDSALVNNGRTAGIVMGILLLMMTREAWLGTRFGSRSVEPQRPRITHEVAHWLGAILMYAVVEVLLFSDGPMRDLEGGWFSVAAGAGILFPIFWIPLQLPQFIRHLASTSTIRQELSWWSGNAMVIVAVGQRYWSG